MSMYELFSFYLQGGLIDVRFLGAAQIDRFGNINTTVIGEYDAPATRLPGSGGACEIAINARQVFVIMRQSKRSFVESIDFPDVRREPGRGGGLGADPAGAGLARPWAVGRRVARPRDLALRRRRRNAPRLGPSGRSIDDVKAATGWEPKVASTVETTPAPTDVELRLIREELDPGAYTS